MGRNKKKQEETERKEKKGGNLAKQGETEGNWKNGNKWD